MVNHDKSTGINGKAMVNQWQTIVNQQKNMDWQNMLCISWTMPECLPLIHHGLPSKTNFLAQLPARWRLTTVREDGLATHSKWKLTSFRNMLDMEYYIASALRFFCCGFLLLATVLPLLRLLFRAASISVSTIGLGDTLQLQILWNLPWCAGHSWRFTKARYAVPTKQLGAMSHSSAPGPRKQLPSFTGLGGQRAHCKRTERSAMAIRYTHQELSSNHFNMHLSQYCQFHPLMWHEH